MLSTFPAQTYLANHLYVVMARVLHRDLNGQAMEDAGHQGDAVGSSGGANAIAGRNSVLLGDSRRDPATEPATEFVEKEPHETEPLETAGLRGLEAGCDHE